MSKNLSLNNLFEVLQSSPKKKPPRPKIVFDFTN